MAEPATAPQPATVRDRQWYRTPPGPAPSAPTPAAPETPRRRNPTAHHRSHTTTHHGTNATTPPRPQRSSTRLPRSEPLRVNRPGSPRSEAKSRRPADGSGATPPGPLDARNEPQRRGGHSIRRLWACSDSAGCPRTRGHIDLGRGSEVPEGVTVPAVGGHLAGEPRGAVMGRPLQPRTTRADLHAPARFAWVSVARLVRATKDLSG
jgi:hypothetical protein